MGCGGAREGRYIHGWRVMFIRALWVGAVRLSEQHGVLETALPGVLGSHAQSIKSKAV